MRTNYHTHTTRCLHATGSDEEFVLSAIKGGYQELGFSDHTPWKYHTDYVSDIRMTPEELPEYVESLRSLQKKYKDQISIKIGLECEYFPEYIPWLKGVIKEYQLDYIIFGNHHFHTDEKFPYFGRNTHTAIIGVDAHNNQYLETPLYYNRANETLQKLGMKVTDRIPFLNEK